VYVAINYIIDRLKTLVEVTGKYGQRLFKSMCNGGGIKPSFLIRAYLKDDGDGTYDKDIYGWYW